MATMTKDAPVVQLRGLIAQGVTVRLYRNNHEPSREDTFGSFIEPDDPLYRPRVIPPTAWTVTGTVAKSPEVQFLFARMEGPLVGYFLTVGELVIGSERIVDAAGIVRRVRPGEVFAITVELRVTL